MVSQGPQLSLTQVLLPQPCGPQLAVAPDSHRPDEGGGANLVKTKETMANADRIIIKPITAPKIIFLALSILLSSPAAVIHKKPA